MRYSTDGFATGFFGSLITVVVVGALFGAKGLALFLGGGLFLSSTIFFTWLIGSSLIDFIDSVATKYGELTTK